MYTAKDDEAGNIALEYGLSGIPETFFIDAEGLSSEKLGAGFWIKLEGIVLGSEKQTKSKNS